jgi:hypothetical protein
VTHEDVRKSLIATDFFAHCRRRCKLILATDACVLRAGPSAIIVEYGEFMLATIRTAHGPNLLSRLLAATTRQQVDDYAKAAWVLNGEGLIADEEMEYLTPVIEHRRKSIGVGIRTVRSKGCVPHCRPAIPLERRASAWLRRRAVAKDCIIPTCLAQVFTVSKLAVLSVIARAVMDHGQSTMSLPEIAARAGVGCTTARYAIRDASRLGMICVSENRVSGFWNRPNTIKIVCARWLRWMRERVGYAADRKSGGGVTSICADTPLRNLIPTIDIGRFNPQLATAKAYFGQATQPCWKMSLGLRGAEVLLE